MPFWNLIVRLGKYLFRQEKAMDAVDAFERLSKKLEDQAELWEKRYAAQQERMDKCDRERAELRQELSELQAKINRHSLEFKSALGIPKEPQPPRRSTRNHVDDKPADEA